MGGLKRGLVLELRRQISCMSLWTHCASLSSLPRPVASVKFSADKKEKKKKIQEGDRTEEGQKNYKNIEEKWQMVQSRVSQISRHSAAVCMATNTATLA